jgi:hypothetical protein
MSGVVLQTGSGHDDHGTFHLVVRSNVPMAKSRETYPNHSVVGNHTSAPSESVALVTDQQRMQPLVRLNMLSYPCFVSSVKAKQASGVQRVSISRG